MSQTVENNGKVKKQIHLSSKMKDNIFVAILLILPIAHFIIFWAYLNVNSILIAFQDEYTAEFTFDNFTRFFDQIVKDWAKDTSGIKIAIQNTLIQGALSMFVCAPLVWFASYVLFKKYFGHTFFRLVFYFPQIVGTVITATMLKYILDATGPVVMLGKQMGIPWAQNVLTEGLLGKNSARTTFFVTQCLSIGGSTILLLTGALQKIPQDIFDAGKLDGTGMFVEFTKIVLPCIWSTVGIMWVMTFAGIWGEYSRSMLLTNAQHGTETFGYYAFNTTLSAIGGKENFNYPAAIGVLMTLVIAPITLLFRWASRKIVQPVEF